MENKKEELIDSKALPIPMLGKELARLEGDTFYLVEHEHGVLFHVYNSMDIIVRRRETSVFYVLRDLIRNKDLYNSLSGEEKENFQTNIKAIMYVLTCPLYAFADRKLLYTIATEIVRSINEQAEEAENVSIQDETIEEDGMFRDAVLATQELANILVSRNDNQKD